MFFVHGDDFVAVGPEKSVAALNTHLRGKYRVKAEIMGSRDGEANELRILNRIVRYSGDRVCIEADPRHCEVTVKEM